MAKLSFTCCEASSPSFHILGRLIHALKLVCIKNQNIQKKKKINIRKVKIDIKQLTKSCLNYQNP